MSSSYGEAALNFSDIKTTDSEVRNTEHLVIMRSARKSGGPLAFMWMLPPNLHVVADQVPPPPPPYADQPPPLSRTMHHATVQKLLRKTTSDPNRHPNLQM